MDDIRKTQADFEEPEHRIGLAVVNDDALIRRDMGDGHERDSVRAIKHVYIGNVVSVSVDALCESNLRVRKVYEGYSGHPIEMKANYR